MTTRAARIVVHDYSGHPGQAQLSRALARRGYEVHHQHCPSYATGKGALEAGAADPPTLSFEPCEMRGAFERYSPVSRVRQELDYGRRVGRNIAAMAPDVAVLSNIPLLAHLVVARHLRRAKVPMVFWQQDIYSAAIGGAARSRLGPLGRPVAWLADRLERHIARASMAVVAISPTFLDTLGAWGVAGRTVVVPNWAPLAELPVRPKANRWSEQMGLAASDVVLYSGTLGLKHDPAVLAHLATAVEGTGARVVVVSEGRGRQWLEQWKTAHPDAPLTLLDFQPYEDLPDVLGSADVLVVVLEADASKYSVPSKALTYLCAGRPILGVMPVDNSVARVIADHGAGVVVDPIDRDQVAAQLRSLLGDDERRRQLGEAGRRYAEETFSAERAAYRFEELWRDRLPAP